MRTSWALQRSWEGAMSVATIKLLMQLSNIGIVMTGMAFRVFNRLYITSRFLA